MFSVFFLVDPDAFYPTWITWSTLKREMNMRGKYGTRKEYVNIVSIKQIQFFVSTKI